MDIQTPLLSISCEIDGPAGAPTVLLLHGWPDDFHAWATVGPSLNARGFRTIVPSLRGFGGTRFLDRQTPRTGEPTAFASDAIALLDALDVDRVIVAGHDWGARIGYTLAALWPQRVERLVAMSSNI